ncbi:MAG: hypothetical protein LBI35_08105 [Burkholderiales bacterium]|jgi:hypothetical protein|nr:hypothetical protein [Burkholderiales bacterium]
MCHRLFDRLKAAFPSLCATVICLFGWFVSPITYAARPMITDDARIVDAKSCQVESWVQFNRDSTEYWTLPGCNFTENLELTFGGARARHDGKTQTTDVLFQGKTLFKTLEPNGWGWGLVAGNVRHPDVHTDRSVMGDLYAYVPTSFSFRDDRVVLHTNLGWLREKESVRHRMTWGAGTEIQLEQLGERIWLIAETFGQNHGRPFYQAGLRYWLVQDRVQIDATYGDQLGSSTKARWFSLGLRLLSPAFLP